MKKKDKKKIAIIFSSSILLKMKNGKNIDKHDYVVRFNRSPTLNFEEYVGSRTDLRVINEHVFKNQKYNDSSWSDVDYNFIKSLMNESIMVVSNNKIYDFIKYEINDNEYKYLHQNFFFKLRIFYKFIFYPELIKIFFKIVFEKKNFSVGLTYLFYSLLNKKNEITLFGFDKFENMKYRSHYFENTGKPGGYHNLDLEHKLIIKLYSKNLIKIIDN